MKQLYLKILNHTLSLFQEIQKKNFLICSCSFILLWPNGPFPLNLNTFVSKEQTNFQTV